MSEDPSELLRGVHAQLRGHVAFEQQMGGIGIPEVVFEPAPAEPAQSPRGEVASAGPRARTTGPASAPPEAPRAPVSEAGATEEVPSELSREERVRRLAVLAEQAAECRACVLHEQRHRNVFARGNPAAELVFVGEGPGRDEDQQGLPFVGAAGQLLDKMVVAMGYARDDVYICNVVKCRPPENRTPRAEEAVACARFLRPQLSLVAPRMIVALGRCAAEHLGVAGPQGPWRGRLGSYQGIPVMPTYHPAFLLRSPQFKRVVWEDLQKVMGRLGRTPPARGR